MMQKYLFVNDKAMGSYRNLLGVKLGIKKEQKMYFT